MHLNEAYYYSMLNLRKEENTPGLSWGLSYVFHLLTEIYVMGHEIRRKEFPDSGRHC